MKHKFFKTIFHNDIAIHVYKGKRRPVIFLIPYPHASASVPIIKSDLAQIFIDLDFEIISFDPPGLFESKRIPDMSLEEMVNCFGEVMEEVNRENEKVTLVAHSMGGFISFPIVTSYPDSIDKIILVGILAGFSSIKRNKGLPYYFGAFNKKYWNIAYYGIRLMYFKGNLAIQKKLDNIFRYESWVDKSQVTLWTIKKEDYHKPPNPRGKWVKTARKYDFYDLPIKINNDTLILVGKDDPQTPVGCSKEIHEGLANSELIIFEKSGHYPFVEEKEKFITNIVQFLEVK